MPVDNTTDSTAGLGQRLLRRAADPGVSRRDLAAGIQRRSLSGGAGLAAEIQQRWVPRMPAAWGYGSELPYFGFGRFGRASEMGSGIPEISAVGARAVPTARTAGAAVGSPAAQALSSLGASLQRRHLGGLGLAASPTEKTRDQSASTRQESQRLVQRLAAAPPPRRSSPPLPPVAELEPASVRRGADGSSVDTARPSRPAPRPGSASSAEPVRSQAAAETETPRSTRSSLQMGPAIVHRAAGSTAVQRKSLAPAIAPTNEAVSAGFPLKLARTARPEPENPVALTTIERTKAANPAISSGLTGLPLQRMTGPATAAPADPPLPVRSEAAAQTVTPRSDRPSLQMEPAIVHRAAGRTAVQRASLAPASALTNEAAGAGFPLQLAQTARPKPENSVALTAFERTKAPSPASSSGLPSLPLQRMTGLATASPAALPLSVRSQAAAQTVTPRSDRPSLQMGPAIVRRTAGRTAVQRASLAPASVLANEAAGAGFPLQLAQTARPKPENPVALTAIEKTKAASPIAPAGAITGAHGSRRGGSGPKDQLTGTATRLSASEVHTALPLVQRRRLSAGDGGARIVQFRRTAGFPTQPPLGTSSTPDQTLTLALPAAVIQRQAGCGEALRGAATAAGQPASEALLGTARNVRSPDTAGSLDLEDIVERVMHRLTCSLAVENERYGGQR